MIASFARCCQLAFHSGTGAGYFPGSPAHSGLLFARGLHPFGAAGAASFWLRIDLEFDSGFDLIDGAKWLKTTKDPALGVGSRFGMVLPSPGEDSNMM